MAGLPYALRPMKATSGTLPHDDDRWAYEIKWDGMRILAFVEQDRLRLKTTNDIEVAARFPELRGLQDLLGDHPTVLDGEVVMMQGGRSDFGALQPRMHLANPAEAERRAAERPVAFVIFDLLHLDGHDTTSLTYEQRRSLLTDLVEPGPTWLVPQHHVGGGRALLDAVGDQGLEGLIAKRLGSRYEPGRRSSAWVKLKVRREQEVVIGGWTDGTGNREHHFGALIVGVHRPDDPEGPLAFAGGVGTGFKGADLDRLRDRMRQLTTDECPFDPPPPATVTRTAHWIRPELVAQVAYGEWTADGRLRHPSYLGLRIDKDPGAVIREP